MAATKERTGRTRATWSGSEIDHVWAHQKAASGRCTGKNVFFEGATIFSYGHHFPMARLVLKNGKPDAVLLTTRSYSVTTSGHKSDVRSATRHLTQFYVDDVSELDHRANLADYRKRVERYAAAVPKAKARTLESIRSLDRLIAEANEYAKYFKLATRFGYPKGFDLAAEQARGAVELEKQKVRDEKKEERRSQRDEERRKRAEAELAEARLKYPGLYAEYEAEVAKWLAWERPSFPSPPRNPDNPYVSYYDRSDRLARLRAKGSRIETSQGVVVELEAAKPLLLLVRRSAEGVAQYPEMEVSGYRGVAFDYADRQVRVGCHRIAFDEVERVARELGL